MRVEARNIAKRFNDAGRMIEVFADLSLEVESGTSLALVGESGAGKTTLLQILGTLEKPTSGEVFIGSKCVTEKCLDDAALSAFRGRYIGFVFQFHYLLQEFDAQENVAMPLILQGERRVDAMERAEILLKRVGLEARLKHRPAALSGGEQQRVAIARALSSKPGVVLADEPTGNLDTRTAKEVQELLLAIQEEVKMTLIVVTHSLELAKSMGRVVELTAGKLVEKVL
ncbi:MAG: ABC transporter ATP-binding protein [Deltaproteobacteria bacterium]|nr:ABC transporter ATP-binding protein [Deltaproteobacteria bacterium]